MAKYGFNIKINVTAIDGYDLQNNIINEIEKFLNEKVGWCGYKIHDVYEIPVIESDNKK